MTDTPLDRTEVRKNFAWFLEIPTRWIDNDLYGHMNNAKYYTFFENVVMTYLEHECSLNTGTGDVRCFTAESGCRYHDALKYPQSVDAGMRVAHVGNSSVRYELGLFAKGQTQVAATGFVLDVFVDAVTEKPTRIPDDFREALARCSTGSLKG